MRVSEVNSTLKDWDWREALEHLGLENNGNAMEAVYELYAVELRNAMDTAGTKALRNLLSQPAIQSAFKLKKVKRGTQ